MTVGCSPSRRLRLPPPGLAAQHHAEHGPHGDGRYLDPMVLRYQAPKPVPCFGQLPPVFGRSGADGPGAVVSAVIEGGDDGGGDQGRAEAGGGVGGEGGQEPAKCG